MRRSQSVGFLPEIVSRGQKFECHECALVSMKGTSKSHPRIAQIFANP
jgi:hypothetical protein